MEKISSNIINEYYNVLINNIQNGAKNAKTILIAPCMQQESGYKLAFNLASKLAEANKKVLFIDADIRKNSVEYGFSNVIFDQNDYQKAIKQSNTKNLFILESGNRNNNPIESLTTNKIKDFFENLKSFCDYIILSSSPVGLVVDSLILANKVDATCLVIEENKDKLENVERCLKNLKEANENFLGIILNNSSSIKEKFTNFGNYQYNLKKG